MILLPPFPPKGYSLYTSLQTLTYCSLSTHPHPLST